MNDYSASAHHQYFAGIFFPMHSRNVLFAHFQPLIGRTLMCGNFWFGQATDVFLLEGLENNGLFSYFLTLFLFANSKYLSGHFSPL